MRNPLIKFKNKRFVLNTKQIEEGDVFISINNGAKHLEHSHLEKISHILVEKQEELKKFKKALLIDNLSSFYVDWIDQAYELNHKDFENFFVTGTNGKTSTVSFMSQIFKNNGMKYASSGTLGTFLEAGDYYQNDLTTQDPLFIRNLMQRCIKESVKNIFFEASSIGLDQNRLRGLVVNHAAFTNITRDHFDYHKTFENYLDSKLKLIKEQSLKTLTINIDDPALKSSLNKFHNFNITKVSMLDKNADIFFEITNQYSDGNFEFTVNHPWGKDKANAKVEATHNIYNLLLCLPYFESISNDTSMFFNSMEKLSLPRGRLEKIGNNIFVDYAHTPEAIDIVCKSLVEKHNKELVIVFGAGGNRDTGKRKFMGQVADQYCKKIIITSDNPRFEEPSQIADMIEQGVKDKSKVNKILDRKEAIEYAITHLTENEMLLIAGKGHENFQEFKNEKKIFSDQETVKKCIGLKV